MWTREAKKLKLIVTSRDITGSSHITVTYLQKCESDWEKIHLRLRLIYFDLFKGRISLKNVSLLLFPLNLCNNIRVIILKTNGRKNDKTQIANCPDLQKQNQKIKNCRKKINKWVNEWRVLYLRTSFPQPSPSIAGEKENQNL